MFVFVAVLSLSLSLSLWSACVLRLYLWWYSLLLDRGRAASSVEVPKEWPVIPELRSRCSFMPGLTTYNSVNLVQRVVVHHVVRVAQLDQRVFDLKTTQLIAA